MKKNIKGFSLLVLFSLSFACTGCNKSRFDTGDKSSYVCFLGEKVTDLNGKYITINNVSYLSVDNNDKEKVDHYFVLNIETNLLSDVLVSYQGTVCLFSTDKPVSIHPSFYSNNKLYFLLKDEHHEFFCGEKGEISQFIFPDPGSRTNGKDESHDVHFILGPLNFGATYDNYSKTGYMRDVQLRMRILI